MLAKVGVQFVVCLCSLSQKTKKWVRSTKTKETSRTGSYNQLPSRLWYLLQKFCQISWGFKRKRRLGHGHGVQRLAKSHSATNASWQSVKDYVSIWCGVGDVFNKLAAHLSTINPTAPTLLNSNEYLILTDYSSHTQPIEAGCQTKRLRIKTLWDYRTMLCLQ